MLRYIVIAGNVVYILWITYNGIDEGFSGTVIRISSYLGLIIVLVLNTFLLLDLYDYR